jgi:histone deacetylase complex regulatory component SIN3
MPHDFQLPLQQQVQQIHPHAAAYYASNPSAAMQMQMQGVATAPMPRMGPAGVGLDYDDAIQYVEKIKHRFAYDKKTYDTFLKILFAYENEQCTIRDVVAKASELFRDHPDLLQDFTFFLPDAQQEVCYFLF